MKKNTTVEHRHTSAAGSLRATQRSDGGPKIGGLAIPYGVMSDDLGGFTERIARGAFTESIKNDDIRALWSYLLRHLGHRREMWGWLLDQDARWPPQNR